jgi:hypothetical protein
MRLAATTYAVRTRADENCLVCVLGCCGVIFFGKKNPEVTPTLTMMKIAFLLCTSWVASGFVVVKTTAPTRLLKPLAVGVVMETEDDARFILSKAKECAYGDSCDVCQRL